MAIKGVDTKCYILALFVRDDGERFLLGSGHYEFKDTQMHFAANAIQNDIVEVQGNDGFLLAGQVRRPGTQSFDGYVGDGTMSKEETESYRRQFFSFFRKNFFYKMIYVFSDGTAIQRKSGFLVDDPTVEELYQMYPEYHVALNFEDVNYYSYSEDEEGQEQYAKEATIDTSSMRATGGLVWDNLGVVWEATQWGGEQTASGTEMTIQNEMNVPSIVDDIRLDGDTEQQTYSGKNLLPPPEDFTQDVNGLTITCSNGEYTFSGNASSGTSTGLKSTVAQYTIREGDYFHYNNSLVSNRINIALRFSDITQFANSMNVENRIISLANYVGKTIVGVTVNFNSGYDFYGTAKPMILNGVSTVTTFEPYVGGTPAPNPDYPQEIHVVTGEQTVTVSNGTNSQSYTISLGTTELCKIGDYQDYIYKGADGWYLHKEVGRVLLDGTNSFNSTAYEYLYYISRSAMGITGYLPNIGLSDYFTYNMDTRITDNGSANLLMGDGQIAFRGGGSSANWDRLYFKSSKFATSADLRTWLASNNTSIYYALATPTDTQITDNTLIGQLNALGAMKLFVGENNLSVEATGTNLPAPLSFKYYTTVAMTGAEWEEGGSGGATVVEVDSITNTYPIWRVKGPAVNPQLSVINTNTTIRYTGTVTSTQTLEIDMFNKTAKLNGVSVIGNVSGDWVSLAPGTNRVIYTAENADAQSSTIEWQEVVG